MKHSLLRTLTCCLALTIVTAALAAPSIEIRLNNGSAWRGELNDFVRLTFVEQGVEIEFTGRLLTATKYYVKVEGALAGKTATKTIFNGDIRSMRTVSEPEAGDAKSSANTRRNKLDSGGTTAATEGEQSRGVFVLPMSGMVGETFRAQEIRKIGEHADSYGPGQIIVLLVDSHGGLAAAMEGIHNSILEVKRRHRVIAWIKTAISAAAAASIACDEIYFMTEGTLGAMTTYAGTVSLKDEQLQVWLDLASKLMENGGRSPYIARAMVTAPALLSYDKDPETGEVTWHDDLSGANVLSTDTQNLVFTSGVAVDSGFADGIADTGEELAKLLDLAEWREIDDYGRSIADDWQGTVKRAKEEIPRLLVRRNMVTGTPEQRIGALIRIDEQLIKWIDRVPTIAKQMIPVTKDFLKREIRDYRKQLADLRKRRR